MPAPRIVTDHSQQPAPTVQQCSMCSNTTARSCIRRLRVDLIGANGQELQQISLMRHFFCGEGCAKAAAAALMEEINTGTDTEILPHLKTKWRGLVQRVFCHYTSVTMSGGEE